MTSTMDESWIMLPTEMTPGNARYTGVGFFIFLNTPNEYKSAYDDLQDDSKAGYETLSTENEV